MGLVFRKMKKIIALLLVVCLAFTLAACGNSPSEPEATPEPLPVETEIPESMENTEPIDEATDEGVIIGDVLYKGIEISRLFVEPFVDVLGEPLGGRDASFFFYEGLEIVGEGGYPNIAIQLLAFEPNFNLFELNGVSLDMTRSEVIAAFGTPLEYWDVVLTYHILNPVADYMLTFRFEDFESSDNTILTSTSMWRDAERNTFESPSNEQVNIAELIGRNLEDVKHLFADVSNPRETGHTDDGRAVLNHHTDYLLIETILFEETATEQIRMILAYYDAEYRPIYRFNFNGFGGTSTRADIVALLGDGDDCGGTGRHGAVMDRERALFFWIDEHNAVAFGFDENERVIRIMLGQIFS
jgi:hypothetical protein